MQVCLLWRRHTSFRQWLWCQPLPTNTPVHHHLHLLHRQEDLLRIHPQPILHPTLVVHTSSLPSPASVARAPSAPRATSAPPALSLNHPHGPPRTPRTTGVRATRAARPTELATLRSRALTAMPGLLLHRLCPGIKLDQVLGEGFPEN